MLDLSKKNIDQIINNLNAYEHPEKVTSLKLSNCNLTSADAVLIATALERYTKITSLVAWDNSNLGAGLGTIVAKLPNLTSLNASWCGLTDENAKDVARGLVNCPKITTLDVSMNRELGAGLGMIVAKLPKLTSLHVGYCGLTDENAAQFAESLNNHNITHLDVSGNKRLRAGLGKIVAKLPNLTSLDANNCELTEENAEAVASSLGFYPNIASLSVSLNATLGAGLGAIVARFPNLTSLSANNCGLSEENAAAVASGLEHCNKIEKLFVWNNITLGAGLGTIVAALPKLIDLHANNCGLNEHNAEAVNKQIAKLAHIRFVFSKYLVKPSPEARLGLHHASSRAEPILPNPSIPTATPTRKAPKVAPTARAVYSTVPPTNPVKDSAPVLVEKERGGFNYRVAAGVAVVGVAVVAAVIINRESIAEFLEPYLEKASEYINQAREYVGL